MNKQNVYWLATLALVMALFAAPRGGWAAEFIFGDFETDVQSGGQYILDPNEVGYAGWSDWEYPEGTPRPTYSPVTPNSTAAFLTSGTYSMPWQPAQTGVTDPGGFPYAGGLDQGLAVKMQDLPAATKVGLFDGFFNNNHIALDAIWDGDEWSTNYLGDGWNGTNVRLRMNYGDGVNPGTSVLLGSPIPSAPEDRFPEIDTGNPGNFRGHWDIANFATPHSRTMAWDYSDHKQAIQDLYTAGDLNETNGYLEFVLETTIGNFVHPVTMYTDNWRYASYSTGTPDSVTNYQLPDGANWPGTPVHTTTTTSTNLQVDFNTEATIGPGGGVTTTFTPDSTFVLDGFAIRAAGAPTTGLLYLYSDPNLFGGTEADGYVNPGPDSGRFAQTLIDGLPYTFFGTGDRTFLVFDLEGEGEIVLQEGVQYAIDLRNTDAESDEMYWLRSTTVEFQNAYTGGNIYARNPVEVGDEGERFDVAGGGRRDGTLALYAELPPPFEGFIGDYNEDGKVSAADFTFWRDHYGAATLPNRDPLNTGPVDEDDFESWKENYGQGDFGAGAGAGLASAVPEPGSLTLAVLAICLGTLLGRRTG